MTEILFLGTGCMQPTKLRNHAGVLLTYKNENILFDCGEGIQRQMRIAGVKPAKVTRLCISHWHGDHVFGIPGLLSSMGADKTTNELQIYGPKGSAKYLEHMLKGFAAKDIIPHKVHEVTKGVAFENDLFSIEVEPLKHSTHCIGFRFREKERRRINTQKVKQLGLSEGPLLGKLQQGKNVIVDGKKILSDEVTFTVKGKIVCYVTDTMECSGAANLARNADLLILEGTLLDNLRKNAYKSKHLTVKQAAIIASENNAKKLVITHISQRYKSNHEIAEEAQRYFNEVVVAQDFMRIRV